MNENTNSNNTEPILPQGDASNTPINLSLIHI